MNNWFQPYFSDHTIQAFCWTLFHSLWIGLVTAALAALVIAGTKKAPAKWRYRLFCSLLVLFICACAFTFLWEISDRPVPSAGLYTVSPQSGSAPGSQATGLPEVSYRTITGLFNRCSGWIFALWLLCFTVNALKLIRELRQVQKVKRTGLSAPGSEWEAKLSAFARQLGIRRTVRLFGSSLVKVPVTIGYLKPVILLPAGMLLQLPPDQLDTILLHELAHILRRDYLFNIFQSLVDAVFFFNPAIWWLSSLIRDERENCCDDLVLALIPKKRPYLEALMAFQHAGDQPHAYAMGLNLRKATLMARLRRLVNQENQKLNAGEKIVLLTGMALLCLCTFVPRVHSEIRHGAALITRQVAVILHPAKSVIPVNEPKQAHHATADTLARQLPVDTLPKVTSIKFRNTNADTANRTMEVLDDRGIRYELTIAAGQLAALKINGDPVDSKDLDRYSALLQHFKLVYSQKAEEKVGHRAIALAASAERHEQALTTMKAAVERKAQHESPRPDSARQTPQKQRRMPSDKTTDQARVRGIIAELVAQKIVVGGGAVNWFILTDAELVVNGQKQPEALHAQLKATYNIKPQHGLYYGPAQITGPGVHLTKEDL